MKTKSIFLDGQMVKARAELIDSLVPGVVAGKGVFETMRVYNGKIFSLDKHFDRLFRGLRLLKVRSSYSKKQLEVYLDRTIKANFLKEARIRLAVWREKGQLRIAVVCQDIRRCWVQKDQKGIRAVVSSVIRKKTQFSNIKSMDYHYFRQAFNEAKILGYDEAILLNNRQEIVEGSRTNIFYIRKGILYTPTVKCGCLNGITRQIVIQLARKLKIPTRAVAATIQTLLRSDEAFVTNSLIGVVPLVAVGNQTIGQGKTRPLTRKFMDAYNTNVHPPSPETISMPVKKGKKSSAASADFATKLSGG